MQLILLLILLVMMSCNRKIQHTTNEVNLNKEQEKSISKSEDYKLDEKITETQKVDYGSYFAKLAPEYAWLDTLQFEDLFNKGWITNRSLSYVKSDQKIKMYGGKFSSNFKNLFPVIPQDSFIMYTAHWFGANEDYNFELHKANLSASYRKTYGYKQFYKNVEVKNSILAVEFKKRDNNKPSRITVDIARNIDLPKMHDSFPYDSLYVLASDSLRNLNTWIFRIKEENHDPNKYPGQRKNFIYYKDGSFYNANMFRITTATKSYEYTFDNHTKKLIDVNNVMNY